MLYTLSLIIITFLKDRKLAQVLCSKLTYYALIRGITKACCRDTENPQKCKPYYSSHDSDWKMVKSVKQFIYTDKVG